MQAVQIPVSPERFQLKTLHEDISLLDRKLAHLKNYETFETDALRDAAVRKMLTRRETLVQKARRMTADGVAYLPSEVPLSLRTNAPSPEARKASNIVSIDGSEA